MWSAKRCLVTLLLFVWAAEAWALFVPCCDGNDIRTALSVYNATNITLAAGTYTGICGDVSPLPAFNFTYSKLARTSVNITGATDGARTVIDCEGYPTAMVSTNADITINHVDFTNNKINGTTREYLFLVDQGSITVNDAFFFRFAAILNSNATVAFTNSTLLDGAFQGTRCFSMSVGPFSVTFSGVAFKNISGLGTTKTLMDISSRAVAARLTIVNCTFEQVKTLSMISVGAPLTYLFVNLVFANCTEAIFVGTIANFPATSLIRNITVRYHVQVVTTASLISSGSSVSDLFVDSSICINCISFAGAAISVQNVMVTNCFSSGYLIWVRSSGLFDGITIRNVSGSPAFSMNIGVASIATVRNATIVDFVSTTGEGAVNVASGVFAQLRDSYLGRISTVASGGAMVVASGGTNGRFSVVNTTFENCQAPTAGAVVYGGPAVTTGVTLVGCTFRSNSALNGAVFYMSSPSAVMFINSSLVADNTCSGEGAILYATNGARAIFNNVTLRSNMGANNIVSLTASASAYFTSSSIEGCRTLPLATTGIIAVASSGRLFISGSRLVGNSAPGGAVFVLRAFVSLVDSLLEDNTARYGGGVQVMIQSEVVITNCVLHGNTAQSGGAIYEQAAAVSITGSTFIGNSAVNEGGALFAQCAWNIQSSTFIGNTASRGGAISLPNDATLTLDICTFTGNAAREFGGAIAGTTRAQLNASQIIVRSNTAASGAGIYWGSRNLLLVSPSSNFSSNNASNGGGALWSNGAVVLDGVRLEGNGAPEGAAIHCEGCALTIHGDSILVGNNGNIGPALYCSPTASYASLLDLALDTTIIGNVALQDSDFQTSCTPCGCCTYSTPMNIHRNPDGCVTAPGFNCSYGCEPGYAAQSSYVTCAASLAPTCIAITCPPYVVGNGTVAYSPVGTPSTGSVATLTCFIYFQQAADATATCVGPNWVGSLACEPEPCPLLGSILHGQVVYLNPLRSTANFSCDPGFALAGVGQINCLGFVWQGSLPRCTPITCPAIVTASIPPHLIVKNNAEGLTGDTLRITCDGGYTLNGTALLTCTGPDWSPFPACIPLNCDALVVENGVVAYTTDDTVVATFTCDEDFTSTPFPVPTLACIFDGFVMQWNGAPPTCNATVCSLSTAAQTYGLCTDDDHVGSTCSIGCRGGYAGLVEDFTCVQHEVNAAGVWTNLGTGSTDLPGCILCDVGSFIGPMAGQLECTKCQHAFTAASGAADISACICEPGYYQLWDAPGMCLRCPDGGFCEGGLEPPVSASGYFESEEGQMVACWPSSVCLGRNRCRDAHQGYLCADCVGDPTHYKKDGLCSVCPHGGLLALQVILVIVLTLAIGIALVVNMIRFSESAIAERALPWITLTTLINFFQQGATFMNLQLPFGDLTRAVLQWLSLANLNFDIYAVSLECFIPMNFYSKNNLILLFPLLFGLVCCATGVAYRYVPRLQAGVNLHRRVEQLLAVFLGGMKIFYIALAQATFRPLHCVWRVDGHVTLGYAPSTACFSSEWWTNVVVAIIAFVTYLFAVPVALIAARRVIHAGRTPYDHPLNGVYLGGFKPQFWYLSVAVLVQRLAYVALAIFLTEDVVFQAVIISVLLFLWVVAMTLIRPFIWGLHTFSEILTNAGLLLLVFGSLIAEVSGQNGVGHVFNFCVFLAVTGVLVALLVIEWRSRQFVRKLHKQLAVSHTPTAFAVPAGSGITAICGVEVDGATILLILASNGSLTAVNTLGATLSPESIGGVSAMCALSDSCVALGFGGGHVEVVSVQATGLADASSIGVDSAIKDGSPRRQTVRFERRTLTFAAASSSTLTSRVTCLAFTPRWLGATSGCLAWGDATGAVHIAAFDDDRHVQRDCRLVGSLHGVHEGRVGRVTFCGALLYSISAEGTQLRRYVISNTLSAEGSWDASHLPITTMTAARGKLFLGRADGTIERFSDIVHGNASSSTDVTHHAPLIGVHATASCVLSISSDGVGVLWDSESRSYEQLVLDVTLSTARAVASCAHGRALFVGTSDGHIYHARIEVTWNVSVVQERFWTERMRCCHPLRRFCRTHTGNAVAPMSAYEQDVDSLKDDGAVDSVEHNNLITRLRHINDSSPRSSVQLSLLSTTGAPVEYDESPFESPAILRRALFS